MVLPPRPPLRRARCPHRLPSAPHSRWPRRHTSPRSSCRQHRQSFPKTEDRFPPTLLFFFLPPPKGGGESRSLVLLVSFSCNLCCFPLLSKCNADAAYSRSCRPGPPSRSLKLPGVRFARGEGGCSGPDPSRASTHPSFLLPPLHPEGCGEISPPAPILTSAVANAQPNEFSDQVTSVRK